MKFKYLFLFLIFGHNAMGQWIVSDSSGTIVTEHQTKGTYDNDFKSFSGSMIFCGLIPVNLSSTGNYPFIYHKFQTTNELIYYKHTSEIDSFFRIGFWKYKYVNQFDDIWTQCWEGDILAMSFDKNNRLMNDTFLNLKTIIKHGPVVLEEGDNSELIYCKEINAIDSSYTLGFYRKNYVQINKNEFELHWEKDLFHLELDKNNILKNQIFYNNGIIIKPKTFILVEDD